MSEIELRQNVVYCAIGQLGVKKGSNGHKHIVDTYNSLYPDLPLRGGKPYKLTYTDNWCAGFVSFVSIVCGLTDIMPVECSCTEMIKLYQKLGRWVEDDACVPIPGDIIMYYWNDGTDYATTDQKNPPNHVGIVTKVQGNVIKVIEGNKGDKSVVGYREVKANGRYIRGFCCPDYASKVKEEEQMTLFNSVKDIPDWAKSAVEKAIKNGYIKKDASGNIGVWEVNLQTLVWMDRAGMLDKKAGNV